MYSCRVIVVFLSATLVGSQFSDFLRPKTIRVTKMVGSCSDSAGAPIVLRNIKLGLANRAQVVSMKVAVASNITEGLKLKLSLNRCRSREALDTCEKYQQISINNLCKLLNADNTPWAPFTKLANPPFGCPLTKGVTFVRNGTFDGSSLGHLPIAGWYWIVEARVLGETSNKVLLCTVLEGQVVPL